MKLVLNPIIRYVILLLFGIAFSSCKSSQNHATTSLKDSVSEEATDIQEGWPELIVCAPEEGELNVFGLFSFDMDKIQPNQIGLKGSIEFGLYTTYGSFNNIRLEICVNEAEQTAYLKRIMHSIPSAGWWTVFRYRQYVPNQKIADAGLYQAVFNNFSALDYQLIDAQDPNKALLLKGWKVGEARFLTISPFEPKKGDPLTVTPNTNEGKVVPTTVDIGVFVLGDPFLPQKHTARKLIEGENLRLELYYQYSGQPGMYVSYSFDKVVLKDSNPKLNNPVDLVVEGQEIDKYIESIGSHHGLYDSFLFTFDHGKYEIKKAGVGGDCELSVSYADKVIPQIKQPLNCHYVHECGKDI